ncbi:hypothetical protein [Actinokineospora inagensis]|nr:hypothetical protein [Actinokineospora inagensis]
MSTPFSGEMSTAVPATEANRVSRVWNSFNDACHTTVSGSPTT